MRFLLALVFIVIMSTTVNAQCFTNDCYQPTYYQTNDCFTPTNDCFTQTNDCFTQTASAQPVRRFRLFRGRAVNTFDINCAIAAVSAATTHQCVSTRRFGCYLERASAGAAAYFRCAGTVNSDGTSTRIPLRVRIQINRASRR